MQRERGNFRLRIQQIYDESKQIFGAGKITAVMKEEGYKVSQEMVREMLHIFFGKDIKYYICAIIDLYARQCRLSSWKRNSTQLVKVFKQTYRYASLRDAAVTDRGAIVALMPCAFKTILRSLA